MASTESFFMTLGHGSPPKFSGDTATVHEFCPTQFCNKKLNAENSATSRNLDAKGGSNAELDVTRFCN